MELGLDVWAIALRHCGDHAWLTRLASRQFRDASVATRPSDDWLAGGVERLVLASPYVPDLIMVRATRVGRLDVLEWAAARGIEPTAFERSELCGYAAHYGHLDAMEWARARDFPWGRASVDAAMNGHLRILEWAHARGCPWTDDTAAFAAVRGHLEVLQWLFARGCPLVRVWEAALAAGHLQMAEWLVAADVAFDGETGAMIAASKGRLDVLEWVAARYAVDMDRVLASAAGAGRLSIVQWASARDGVVRPAGLFGYPTGNAVASAAVNGHLDVVAWLVESGAVWDPATCLRLVRQYIAARPAPELRPMESWIIEHAPGLH